MMNNVKVSRFIAMVLRHRPESAGLTLDTQGWADVNTLLKGVKAAGYVLDRQGLQELVAEDRKGRYAFDENGEKIRANHGHSVVVDLGLRVRKPPDILYHGTAEKYVADIRKKGLLPQTRQYVHLSPDKETAAAVGRRHGKLVLYEVRSGDMDRAGFEFRCSESAIWLVKAVPSKFLRQVQV